MEQSNTDKRIRTWVSADGKHAVAKMSLGSGGGMKLNSHGELQPCDELARYASNAGGGSSPGPVYRGKVTLPHEVRGKVTQPAPTPYPPPAAPKEPHLTYGQTSGELTGPDGALLGRGYAGQKEGRNNPDAESIKGVGPLPQGNWRMEQLDKETSEKKGWPEPSYKLTPDDETRKRVEALGRDPDSFYIHAQAWDEARRGRGDSEGVYCSGEE